MIFQIRQTIDIKKDNPVLEYKQGLDYGNNLAHEWLVFVEEDGALVDLASVAVTGYFLREDGVTVKVDGSVKNGACSVVFDRRCYLVEGAVKCAMVLTRGAEVVTSAKLRTNANQNITDQIIDTGDTIPTDIYDLLTQIDAMREATAATVAATVEANAAAQRANAGAERVEQLQIDASGLAGDSNRLGGQLPSYYATAESVTNIFYNNASAHSSIYRGKNLGSAVTAEQYAAIQAGTFDDMYIGDYWVINGVNWRIAAFDYYYGTGDTNCTTHHVVIVPDTALYTAQMNTINVTTGAYVGSAMYTSNLANAKTAINNAFGSGHILSHRQYLQNATTDGYASGGSWYDSTVELMTEQNVYGCMVFGNCINGTNVPKSYTVDKSQFPLFALDHTKVNIRSTYWLRDVDSAYSFCIVGYGGGADYSLASDSFGVRPAFSIKS